MSPLASRLLGPHDAAGPVYAGAAVPAWVYGSLRREWIRLHGYAPPIELVPQSKEDTP